MKGLLLPGGEEKPEPPGPTGPSVPDPGEPEPGLDARPANPTCLAPVRPTQNTGVTTQPAFPQLTFTEPLGILQAPGDGSRLLAPGSPERSARLHALDAWRMPPLASRVVDTEGVDVVDAWIRSLTACP